MRSKIRAFLAHFLLSAAVVGTFVWLVAGVWYPDPHLEISGVVRILIILVAVDIVIGPLLTMIVYRPGKPGLRRDLSVIVSLQVAAFLYGAQAVYVQRPAYMVYVVDRFEVISLADAKDMASPPPSLKVGLFSGPRLVYTTGPEDPIARGEILLSATAGGRDISGYPEYYQPYEFGAQAISSRAKQALVLADDGFTDVDYLRTISAGYSPSSLSFIPVVGREKVMSLVLNPLTAVPMASLDIEYW